MENTTLTNGEVVTEGGRGRFCMNCHISRRDAETYVEEFHSHFGPHHSNQTDMFVGLNAITFGMNVPSSTHKNVVEDGCVTCHMAETPASGEPGHNKIGEHTWSMHDDNGTPEDPSDDADNIAACVTCHGPITSFDDLMAKADHDKDGTVETAQEEIAGLMDEVGKMLPPIGDPAVVVTAEYTPLQLRAAYNHAFVHDDGSHGVHNYRLCPQPAPRRPCGIRHRRYRRRHDSGDRRRAERPRPKKCELSGDALVATVSATCRFSSIPLWRRVDANQAMGKAPAVYQSIEAIADKLTKLAVGTPGHG